LPTAHVNWPGHAATWQAEILKLPSYPSHFGAAAGHDDGAICCHWLRCCWLWLHRQLLLRSRVGVGVMIAVVDENLWLPKSIVDTMALHLRILIGFGAHKPDIQCLACETSPTSWWKRRWQGRGALLLFIAKRWCSMSCHCHLPQHWHDLAILLLDCLSHPGLTALLPAGNVTQDSDPRQRKRVINRPWGGWSHCSYRKLPSESQSDNPMVERRGWNQTYYYSIAAIMSSNTIGGLQVDKRNDRYVCMMTAEAVLHKHNK
jgi:hypothetical protein